MIAKLFALLIAGWLGTLSVLVAWPMVTDAPWEADAPEPIRIVETAPARSRCDDTWQQLADAQTIGAGRLLSARLYKLGCR